jgi:hypothetical protein
MGMSASKISLDLLFVGLFILFESTFDFLVSYERLEVLLTPKALKIMFVWMISSLVNMSMYVDMVFFTFMDMAVVNLIECVGGVAEKIPIMRNNYLVEIKIL